MKQLDKYLKDSKISNLFTRVKLEFEKRGPISHSWDHIYRVIINAIKIGEAEKADMNIVLPAVILHDIGFLYDPNPSVHCEVGFQKSGEWIKEWPKGDQKKIALCIKRHKGKVFEFKEEPESLEEKVVHDADMLEKAGAVGVLQGVRTFVEFAETTKPEFKQLKNIVKKLLEMKGIPFYTKTGQKLGKIRGGLIRTKVFKKALEELEENDNY